MTIVVRGFLNDLLATRGYGIPTPLLCFVAPLSVQADQARSDAVANISPTAVQIDATASNATFGNINPTSVQ